MIIGIEASHAQKKDRTGVEEYCFQVIQHLKQVIPSDVRVILYSQKPLQGTLADLPASWESKVLSWPFKKLWSQIRLAGFFLRHKPDIFFAPGQLLPLIVPKNTVVTIHDSAFIPYKSAYHFFGRLYLGFMNKLIIRKAKKIITPSEFSKQELVRYYKMEEKNIQVIPEGYNKEIYCLKQDDEKEIEEIFRKYSITKPFLLTIGRLEEKKNTKRIIEAFNMIKKEFNVELVLVGKPGVGYEEIKKAIQASVYSKGIKEVGFISSKDCAMLLRHTEVFIFPSLYEGFGLPVLEAMATGAPVTASKGSSLEEVGRDAACYVDPHSSEQIAEGVLNLLKNKELKDKKRAEGLERVKLFFWEKTAEAVWQVFKSYF